MATEISQNELDNEIYDIISKLEEFVSISLLGFFSENSDISNDHLQRIITILDSLENIDGLVLYEKQLKRSCEKWNWVIKLYKEQKDCLDFIIDDNINSIVNMFNKIITHLEEEQTIPKESVPEDQLTEYYSELQNKIFDLQNRRAEFDQLAVEDFYGVESQLSYFEDKNIDYVRDKLDRQHKYWSALYKTYGSLSDEKKNSLFINYFILINDMFMEIHNSIDEKIFEIDESELLELENEVTQFDDEVSNVFFEERKELYPQEFKMEDGEDAYQLCEPFNVDEKNLIKYISKDGLYFNQNKKLYYNTKVKGSDVKLKYDTLNWIHIDAIKALHSREGKIFVTKSLATKMNNYKVYAYEVENNCKVRNINYEEVSFKYIALNGRIFDSNQKEIPMQENDVKDVEIIGDEIHFYCDSRRHEKLLATKSEGSISRKDVDITEKQEVDQRYQDIKNKITEFIAKLENRTDSEEHIRLQNLLSNLETSRKRYIE